MHYEAIDAAPLPLQVAGFQGSMLVAIALVLLTMIPCILAGQGRTKKELEKRELS